MGTSATTATNSGFLSSSSPHHSPISASSSSSPHSDKRPSDSPPPKDRKVEEKEEDEEEEEITPREDLDSMPSAATHKSQPCRHSQSQPPSAVPAARVTLGDFNTADSKLLGSSVSSCCCGTSRDSRSSRETKALSPEAETRRGDKDNTWFSGDDETALILLDEENEEGNKWGRRKRRRRRRRKRNEGEVISEGVKKRPCGTPLCAAVILSLLSTASATVSNDIHAGLGNKDAPRFGESIQNVTVAAGREARLSCIVDNLGDYRVGWLKVDSQTILTLQNRVVTHNARVTLTHDQHRTWNLHIRQVKESDSGCYMCQINTPIMQNQVGCIKVHVPPDIINDETSSDTTVNEGDSVTLRCVAEGFPKPEIKWKREDGRRITLRTSSRDLSKEVEAVPGNNLTLESVSRKQMGAYLCIASNKVPPSVSKRIIVNVNFSPVVKADNQLIGSPIGKDVEIECHVEAYPKAVNYWERENGEMLLDGRKYKLEENVDIYRVTMKLVIQDFKKGDAGQYKCISTNSLGKADTSIRLYEIEVPTPRSTTEHLYHPYSTTPHSKSVNLIRTDQDYRKNTDGASGGGGGGGMPGGGGGGGGAGIGGVGRGGDFINYGLGADYKTREDGRNRQRSDRLEYDKTGGVDGFFPPPGEGMDGQGSGAPSLRPALNWRGVRVGGVVALALALALVSVSGWLLGNPI